MHDDSPPDSTRSGRVVICGWNVQGRRAVDDLQKTAPGLQLVVVAEPDDADVPPIPDAPGVTHVCGDPTDADVLQRADLTDAQAAVILADRCPGGQPDTIDARTLLAALTVRQLDASVHLIAELQHEESERLAVDAGVDEAILARQFSGAMLTQSLASPALSRLFGQLFETGAGAAVREREVPDELVGAPYSHAVERAVETGLGAVAGLFRGDRLHMPPAEDLELQRSDRLLLMQKID